ncbi:MAG: tyrosine-protein kinase [Solirubrobacteraceae bacterium]|nr:tyrosine-protein kinase [Solirubrobacteraceae bacterium]
MTSENGQWQSGRAAQSEEPIEVGRYFEALRRNRWHIFTLVAIITITAYVVSLTLPKSYETSASIVVSNASNTAGSESEGVQRSLATTATLVTTSPVLALAAKSFPGETQASLAKRVSASVTENANIINIKVTYGTAQGAARLASAVVQAFLDRHAAIQRSQNASVLTALNAQIAALRTRAAANPSLAAQLSALQARAAELEAANASASSQLQLAQSPQVPGSASSPRPLRNAIIALFAAIFLAVLLALGREQLTPRVTSQRELGHLLGLPVLSGIPLIGNRISARYARVEYEAYQTLSAAVRLSLPPGDAPQIMLVTSATHGEGKTTVTTRLGRMLAQAGHRTLIISGDLRWPKLDDAFDVSGRAGLRELLSLTRNAEDISVDDVRKLIRSTRGGEGAASRGELDILPSGRRDGDASELLHTPALQSLIAALRSSDYTYILIDSPPVLGIADAQMFAQFSDEVLLVARLDYLKISDVVDLRDMLDRLNASPVGLVVIGTRPSDSPYYAVGPPAATAAS